MSDEVHEIESVLRQFEPVAPQLDWKAIWIEQGKAEARAEMESKAAIVSSVETRSIPSSSAVFWKGLSGVLSVSCGLLLVLWLSSVSQVPETSLASRETGEGISAPGSSSESMIGSKATDLANPNQLHATQTANQNRSSDLNRLVNTSAPQSFFWAIIGQLIFDMDWNANGPDWYRSPESELYRQRQAPTNHSFVAEPVEDPILIEWQQLRKKPTTFSLWEEYL